MAVCERDLPTSALEGRVTEWLVRLDSTARAALDIGPVDRWLISLGDTRIRVRAAGPALGDWLLPALGHAVGASVSHDAFGGDAIDLAIWDQATTGVAPPSPFWDSLGWANRGELPALAEDGIVAAYHEHAGYLAVSDAARKRAWIWVRDAAAVPRYERAAPLRGPLSLLLSWAGGQFVHAGAVATDRGAALLAGPGGVGKSTTSVACLAGGLGYLGDDYVLVQHGPQPPAVHMLYPTAKLTERSFDMLPRLRPLADGPGTPDEKAVLMLSRSAFRHNVLPASHIAAIILPRIGAGPECTWSRSSPIEALKALAPTTLFQLPGAGEDALSRLSALARSVPVFALSLGRDMAAIPGAVRAIIAEAAGAVSPPRTTRDG